MFKYFVGKKEFYCGVVLPWMEWPRLAALAQSSETRAVAEDTWSGLSLQPESKEYFRNAQQAFTFRAVRFFFVSFFFFLSVQFSVSHFEFLFVWLSSSALYKEKEVKENHRRCWGGFNVFGLSFCSLAKKRNFLFVLFRKSSRVVTSSSNQSRRFPR